MIPFDLPTWAIKLGIVVAVFAGAVWFEHYLINVGVTREGARRDRIEAENSKRADQARDDLNARIRGLQANLAAARADLLVKKKELDNEKAISTALQSDLIAGRQRERVLVAARARPADPDRPAAGSTAGVMDSGASTEVDLDPRVAGWLEGVRSDYNAAVKRLDACITSYDTVKAAVDAMP